MELIRDCKYCGSKFIIQTDILIRDDWRFRYCSSVCCKNSGEFVCLLCNEIYVPQTDKNNKNKNRRFCSALCQNRYANVNNKSRKEPKKIEFICDVCGKTFYGNSLGRKYCSKECSKKRQDQYHKERYKLKYFDIFQRDDFRCQYCGKTPQDGVKLVIDHIYPVEKGGEADYYNLITSCERCNGHKHNRVLHPQLIFKFWNIANGNFRYNELKKIWEHDLQQRRRTYSANKPLQAT